MHPSKSKAGGASALLAASRRVPALRKAYWSLARARRGQASLRSLLTLQNLYWSFIQARRCGERIGNTRKLRKLANRHWGGRCFIIGNGPSLKMEDLERLTSEITFAANKIYLAFDATSWRPTYYVVEDDWIIQQHHGDIRRLVDSVKIVNGRWKELFRGDRRVVWYPWLHANEFPQFSGDACFGLYCGYMVTFISLQLAFHMGFSRVYLLGVDFDYFIPEPGEAAGADRQDHFTANYFQPGERRYLPQLERATQAMVCARRFYQAAGRSVYNATRGGKLEVFERISLEDALGQPR